MLDLDAVEADLRRMQLEIERVLRLQSDTNLIQRHGSVRGRQFHVYNTLRRIQLRNQWKKDYIVEDESKVVLFYTSCRVIGETWERCRTALDLLRSLSIHVELRDLHISSDAAEEVLDRLGLSEEERGFLNTCLPLVYVNGYYFGNHSTLIELNEKGLLKSILYDFEGRQKCSDCGDAGYTVCKACRGGKKSEKTIFNQNLRCSFCDENGIVSCKKCLR